MRADFCIVVECKNRYSGVAICNVPLHESAPTSTFACLSVIGLPVNGVVGEPMVVQSASGGGECGFGNQRFAGRNAPDGPGAWCHARWLTHRASGNDHEWQPEFDNLSLLGFAKWPRFLEIQHHRGNLGGPDFRPNVAAAV